MDMDIWSLHACKKRLHANPTATKNSSIRKNCMPDTYSKIEVCIYIDAIKLNVTVCFMNVQLQNGVLPTSTTMLWIRDAGAGEGRGHCPILTVFSACMGECSCGCLLHYSYSHLFVPRPIPNCTSKTAPQSYQ